MSKRNLRTTQVLGVFRPSSSLGRLADQLATTPNKVVPFRKLERISDAPVDSRLKRLNQIGQANKLFSIDKDSKGVRMVPGPKFRAVRRMTKAA
jgi:hypothetical protein